MNKQEAIRIIDQKQELICSVSDQLWEHPELKFQETQSAKLLCDALRDEGFSVETGLSGIPTAFCGRFGSGGPVIGILGEFDALSDLSQKAGVAEQIPLIPGGNGHGCGHNNLGAGSLAAAIAVKEYLKSTGASGTVLYFGCPGEEGGSGKAFMARDGVFDQLDIALCWHPMELTAVWTFTTLANVQVRYRFSGVASHAGTSPHMGRSALDAVELMNVGVQFLREHIIPEARVHYAITDAGGVSPNVVQPGAEVLYLIRAPHNTQLLDIRQRVDNIAQGAALMTGTTVEITLEKGCSNVIPNNALEALLFENMKGIPLPTYTDEERKFAEEIRATIPKKVTLVDQLGRMGPKALQLAQLHNDEAIYEFLMPYFGVNIPVSGSSDVGDVSWVCPTAQIIATTVASGTINHSWQQVAQGKSSVAHKGTLYAGKVLASAAIDLLENPALIEKAKSEHRSRVGEDGYISLIPKDTAPQIDTQP